MPDKPLESDWKTFRRRVPQWRERYLDRTNEEIAARLTDETKTPTERFWEAKDAVDEEAKILVDCLDGHSRSNMKLHLLLMYRHGLVMDADLNAFSDALREWVLMASAR